jgi:hypothetical protein
MNEKLNTYKNFAIAGLSFAAGSVARIWLGDKIGKGTEALVNLLIGISGSATATEIDRIKIDFMKLWVFRGKNPDAFNHDVLRLSETALNLSITEGIGRPYKKKLEDQDITLTSELKKEIDTEINKLQEASKSWKFSDSDAIKYVDFKGNYSNNPLEILISEVELPEICKSLPFNDYFKDNFPKVYQIYFGELLKKPEYNKALIAYQRQVQGLMMEAIEAIKQKEAGLTAEQIEKISEKINNLASGDITKAIDDVNKSLLDITVRLDEIQDIIKQYFKSKTLKIEELRGKKLKYAEGEVSANLKEFREQTQDFLFFKYRGFSHSIDDLTEEDFDYFTKQIKVNHILIPNLLNAIKDTCIQWDETTGIYNRIKKENWLKNDNLLKDCRYFITQNLLGIIEHNLNSLFRTGILIDENASEQKNIKEYIVQCEKIMRIFVDVSVAVLLTRLCEDDMDISDKDKTEINAYYFENEGKTIETQRNFAYRLMNIFALSGKKADSIVLQELLKLKESFGENGILSVSCKEIEKLRTYGDVNPFDNYRAEKILTEFLRYFAFLTNYNMISIRKIEYHNIKKCEPKYIQHCSSVGFSPDGKINNQATADTFTHAVFLQNRTGENMSLNLYPFVIDSNVLKKNGNIHSIAFFNYQNIYANSNYLDYTILNFEDSNNPDYNRFRLHEFSDKDDRYSEINIEKHNTNCLLESFGKIKKILTGN